MRGLLNFGHPPASRRMSTAYCDEHQNRAVSYEGAASIQRIGVQTALVILRFSSNDSVPHLLQIQFASRRHLRLRATSLGDSLLGVPIAKCSWFRSGHNRGRSSRLLHETGE